MSTTTEWQPWDEKAEAAVAAAAAAAGAAAPRPAVMRPIAWRAPPKRRRLLLEVG